MTNSNPQKKKLWEYTMHFPHKEECDSCDSFDQYITEINTKKEEVVRKSGLLSVEEFFSLPRDNGYHENLGAFKWVEDEDEDNPGDCLYLGYAYSDDIRIPVTKDDHDNVYAYLKPYFEYL